MHPCGVCLAEGVAKGLVGLVVGAQGGNSLHLGDKEDVGGVIRIREGGQLADVLDPSLGGGVGKIANALPLQSTALDLQVGGGTFGYVDRKIKAGRAVGDLAAEGGIRRKKAALTQPFCGDGVGGLGVHVDEQNTPVGLDLLHGHEVVGGLSFGVFRGGEVDGRPCGEEFFTPPRVFDVDGDSLTVKFHQGDEAVGTGQKFRLDNGGGVGHITLPPFFAPRGSACPARPRSPPRYRGRLRQSGRCTTGRPRPRPLR